MPSPDALLVTGVTPAMLEDLPLSHLEMMAQIARIIVDCKPAMLIGYNTIRFDDEVLRQSFYQTLLPPYLAAMTGHGGPDVLTMLRAVVMLEPSAVAIPRDDAGKPIFKLDDVCRANSITLSEDDAHDALADVRATRDLFALLEPGEPLLLGGTSHLTPVLPMISAPTNPAARVCIDLSAPELLARTRPGALRRAIGNCGSRPAQRAPSDQRLARRPPRCPWPERGRC